MAQELFEKLRETQRLPSPPVVALRVMELAENESATMIEVADTVASDPAIAARLLKYANSPLVAPQQEVTTVRRAVMLLGIRAVKSVTLCFSLIQDRDQSRCPHFDFDLYWSHAIATAASARCVAKETPPVDCEEAFIVGLLARIGKLALAMALPEQFDAVLVKTGGVMHAAAAEEQAAFRTNHIEIGAELLSAWGLPALLVDAVRHQADPDAAQNENVRCLASAIQQGGKIADVLCGVVSESDSEIAAQLGDGIMQQLDCEFREMKHLLNIPANKLPPQEALQKRAHVLLDKMSVTSKVPWAQREG